MPAKTFDLAPYIGRHLPNKISDRFVDIYEAAAWLEDHGYDAVVAKVEGVRRAVTTTGFVICRNGYVFRLPRKDA